MRAQILAAGVGLAASYAGYRKYAKPVIEKHSDKITLTKFYGKKLIDDGKENFRKVVADAEDTARRAWWFYTHPEVLGITQTHANVGWLNPFFTGNSKEYHEVKKIWTWADAPNIFVGDREVEPMGKRLLRSPTYDGPATYSRRPERAAS